MRADALAALAGDVLTASSRRRTLWYYLIASTAVTGALVLGTELTVDLRQVAPAGGGAVTLLRPPLPGSVRLTVGRAVVPDDGQGRLGVDGAVDYARGVVTIGPRSAPDVAPVVTLTYAVSLVRLSGAERERVLAEGVATHLSMFGYPTASDPDPRKADAPTLEPARAAPYLYLVLVGQLLVRYLACLIGVALGLLATFDAVSSALEPGAAELLLSRPISRGEAVLGRFLGGLAFALLQVGWSVGLVTLLGGIKLGVWTPLALALVPPVLLKFAVLLSIVTLVAVWTRAPALGLAAGGGLWLASFAIYTLQSNQVDSAALAWAGRVAPPIAHLDDLVSLAARIPADLPGHGLQALLGLAAAWVVVPLLVTVAIVRRRDY